MAFSLKKITKWLWNHSIHCLPRLLNEIWDSIFLQHYFLVNYLLGHLHKVEGHWNDKCVPKYHERSLKFGCQSVLPDFSWCDFFSPSLPLFLFLSAPCLCVCVCVHSSLTHSKVINILLESHCLLKGECTCVFKCTRKGVICICRCVH